LSPGKNNIPALALVQILGLVPMRMTGLMPVVVGEDDSKTALMVM
jgi:hypothetical protein